MALKLHFSQALFQHNLCYYQRLAVLIFYQVCLRFNTSHVLIKEQLAETSASEELSFNTSHILIEKGVDGNQLKQIGVFNTSYVLIKGKLTISLATSHGCFNTYHVVIKVVYVESKSAENSKFQYISCCYQS